MSSEQKTTLFSMHLVGAVLTFGFGAVYIMVQTALSLRMQPRVHSRTVFLVRLSIGIWTVGSIISSILEWGVGLGEGVEAVNGSLTAAPCSCRPSSCTAVCPAWTFLANFTGPREKWSDP